MSNATKLYSPAQEFIVADAAYTGGELIQMPSGRAGIIGGLSAVESGQRVACDVEGQYTVTKTASQVWLAGSKLWWDHSANAATCVPQYADRDFEIGIAADDAAAADTTGVVILNEKPRNIISLQESAFDTAIVAAAGSPSIFSRGGAVTASFSTTAEAQKLDLLSKRSFPVGANWILEADLEIITNADADAADLNIGVANGTNASDADSITESCFVHFDMGADLNIDAESDDGTTEVAATDTTIDWAVGQRIHLAIDGRDPTDIQIYVDGVLVLGSTVFTLEDATGPLYALFHLEKSANDTAGVVQLDNLTVRTMEQDSD